MGIPLIAGLYGTSIPVVDGEVQVMADERLRADARRNRARVLEVAAEVFATEGFSVPVAEIARRAGVGTGTVSRHFPTKEDLVAAIVGSRLTELTIKADELARREDPGTAFFALFIAFVRAGAEDCGLAEVAGGRSPAGRAGRARGRRPVRPAAGVARRRPESRRRTPRRLLRGRQGVDVSVHDEEGRAGADPRRRHRRIKHG
ncbi:hypothetical protein GCM10020001_097980 [Nonomuraea salmonea]